MFVPFSSFSYRIIPEGLPIYFRMDLLRKLSSQNIADQLIQSIKDVTEGFIAPVKN
jgi:hypothetical protein